MMYRTYVRCGERSMLSNNMYAKSQEQAAMLALDQFMHNYPYLRSRKKQFLVKVDGRKFRPEDIDLLRELTGYMD